jgi:methylated-DNA-[protein]-cysteine S-methyltransferase
VSEVLFLEINRLKTPIGEMLVVVDSEGNLRSVDWTDHERQMYDLLNRQYGDNGYCLKVAS